MNNAIGECDDILWDYIDIEDAARYYLVMEIISHLEAYSGSTYLFRNRGENEKWHFSPIWDCGQAFYQVNQHFFESRIYSNHWIESMLMNRRFIETIETIWVQFMNSDFNGFYADIHSYINHIAKAAESDTKRWGNAPAPDGYSPPLADNSNIRQGSDEVIERIEAKIEWMKSIYGDYTSIFRPKAPGKESAIVDLQGRRVKTPVGGEIYIRNGALFRLSH